MGPYTYTTSLIPYSASPISFGSTSVEIYDVTFALSIVSYYYSKSDLRGALSKSNYSTTYSDNTTYNYSY